MRSSVWIFLLMIVASLSSCQSIKYVPVESVRYDSIYRTLVQRDSVYLQDSVFVRERGDTVYQYRYRYLFRDKVRHDTVYVAQIDSIRVPYPVEKGLTRWQKMKQEVGGIAIGALVGVVIGLITWMAVRFRRK